MLWLNFIHLYQPANSSSERIKEATEKSYLRLIRLLEEHENLKFTANISGCLLQRWQDEAYSDLISRLKYLVNSGRLELVGSAAYHAFLPFLPEREVRYQIREQERITLEVLGVNLRGGGFFLPEMAYTPSLGSLVKDLGYSWLILDEASLPAELQDSPSLRYRDRETSLDILIRQRNLSNSYLPDTLKELSLSSNLPAVILTASDAELYGLRHEDPTAELEKMASWPELETETLSNFLKSEGEGTEVDLRTASWETDWQSDSKRPFSIWRNPKNKIQNRLWRLALIALDLGERFPQDENSYWYRWHLDRGLASCAFWWASDYDFSHNFGPRAWNPDEVEAGLNDLLHAIRSISNQASLKDKLEAERLAAKIKLLLWRKHWRQHWLKKSQGGQ